MGIHVSIPPLTPSSVYRLVKKKKRDSVTPGLPSWENDRFDLYATKNLLKRAPVINDAFEKYSAE